MQSTLAFDVFGTLIDTHGVVELLQEFIGERALEFSHAWRDKQLEYTFRRAVMQKYRHFSVCTADSLDFTCMKLGVELTIEQKQSLLSKYKKLPAFPDVAEGLAALPDEFKVVAFSNGERASVVNLLENAELINYFDDIITADEINTFKPNPAIYQHLLTRTQTPAKSTWLISSNPFDVIGARAQLLQSIWVKRVSSAAFDPWEEQPNAIISNLQEINQAIA